MIPHLAEAMEAPKQEEFVIDPPSDGAVEMEIDGGGFLDDDDDTDDDFWCMSKTDSFNFVMDESWV